MFFWSALRRAEGHSRQNQVFPDVLSALDLLRRRERELLRITLQVRVLSLTVDQMYDRSPNQPGLPPAKLAQLVRHAGQLFRDRREGRQVLASSLALRAEIAHAVQSVTAQAADAYAVLDSVSLLGRVEQLRQEITVDSSIAGPADTGMPTMLSNLASLYGNLRRPADTVNYGVRAVSWFDENGQEKPALGFVLLQLGRAQRQLGRL